MVVSGMGIDDDRIDAASTLRAAKSFTMATIRRFLLFRSTCFTSVV